MKVSGTRQAKSTDFGWGGSAGGEAEGGGQGRGVFAV